MKAIVYKLLDPDTQEPRYIGVTTIKHLNSRLTVHIRKARLGLNDNKLSRWIKTLLDQGKKPLIVPIMEFNDKKAANEAETMMIQAFKIVGHPLVNTYKM